MAYDGLITSYIGQGTAAARPAAPNVSPSALSWYHATDTGQTSLWAGGAWIENVLALSSGVGTFNGRSGTVTLTSSDVTTALSFTPMRGSNNLSDVSSAATARTNLGLGSAATQPTTAFLSPASNLGDVASASAARANLGVIGGFTAVAADRTALSNLATTHVAAYLKENGREGTFVWSSANNATNVTNDPNQGIYVAPASDTTGASGAWVRTFSGATNVKWFGATGLGVADDSGAIIAALAFLKSIASNPINSFYKASGELFLPAGKYNCGTTTIEITHTLTIRGEGGGGFGTGGGAATMLKWADGSTGIRVQEYNTSGVSTVDPSPFHFTGAYTTLRGLYLYGGFSSTESESHGIHTKTKVILDDVVSDNFSGDALYVHTSVGGGSPTEGNSNCSRAYNCHFRNSRNGVSITGGDANAWTFIGCFFDYNRSWGVNDTCFLGNTYIGCHEDSNGITGNSANFGASVVSYSGNRYACVYNQEANASVNAPSGNTTDTAYWYYIAAGGVGAGGPFIPAWVSGMTLRAGGPMLLFNGNQNSVVTGNYVEGGQGQIQQTNLGIVMGGSNNTGVKGGTWLRGYTGGYFRTTPMLTVGNIQQWQRVNESFLIDGSQDATSLSSPVLNIKTGIVTTGSGAINYQKSDGTVMGSVKCVANFGLIADGLLGVWLRFNAVDTANVNSTGLNIASGKNLQYAGTAVLTAGVLTAAASPALTGDVTKPQGSLATTIAANAVTYAKMQAAAGAGVVGATAAGALGLLTSTQLTTLINAATTTLSGAVPAPGTATGKFLKDDLTWASPPGAGTVTTVSVVTANGVSGSVATSTSTPAITITLGAITPTSVAASGTVTGSNLSGTNTGDQTSVSGNAGTATALQTPRTINGVSFDGTANITINAVDSTSRVPTTRTISTTAPLSGGGDLSADRTLSISAATSLAAGSMSAADKAKLDAITGSNTGDQTISITGDGTAAGSTGALALTVTKINGVALSGLATGILKNTTTTGVPSIAVAADFPTLNQNTTGSAATLTTARNFSISGGGITAATASFDGSAAVVLSASVDASHITLARMADVATSTVFYRKTGGTGAPEVQTLATLKADLGLTGTNTGDQTITLTGPVTGTGIGSFATTITAAAVTYAKIQNVAASALLGNPTGSGAAPSEITLAGGLDFSGSTLRGAVVHPGYVAGRWYCPIEDVTFSAGAAPTAGSIRLLPFTLAKSITVSDLGARVTTLSTSGNFQLAIYANNAATGRPTGTALCSTGNISTGATGALSLTVGSSVLLPPGTYWMAVNQDNAVAVYQTIAQATCHFGYLIGSTTLASVTVGAGSANLCLNVTQTFGTWPDLTSASFGETVNLASALVFLKAA